MHNFHRLMVIALSLGILSSCITREPKPVDPAEHDIKLAKTYGSSGAAFSPDGQFLALANRDNLWIIKLDSRQVVRHVVAPQSGKFGTSKGLLFIDDHRLLIGRDGGIVIYDLTNGISIDILKFASIFTSPRAMAWSPVTQTLAFSTSGLALPVNLVEISESGFGPYTGFPGFEGVPADLLFSDDGRFLAATGDDEGVLIREISSGAVAGELPTRGYVNELARFGDNRVLVAGADLAFWGFYTDSQVAELEDPNLQGQVNGQVAVRILGATALGALTAVLLPFAALGGSGDEWFQMVEATYRVAKSPVYEIQGEWCGRSTAITRDGKLLADVYPGITKEVIQVVSVESGKVIRKINPPGDYSCKVLFSPDGSKLLITSSKVARIYATSNWTYSDLTP